MTRTTSMLFLVGLIIIASLGLYRTSNRVQELDHELRGLNAMIESERENMHVLKAEWVYLANPARVEAAAKKHLDLRPTATRQIASLSTFADMLPARSSEAVASASVTVSAKPLASIKSTLKSTFAAIPARAAALIHRKPSAATSLAATAPSSGYLTDHIAIQRTASAEALPNSITAVLEHLNASTR